MTLQTSGQISYINIRDELNLSSGGPSSMNTMTANAIGDAGITAQPDSIEEWYGYEHIVTPAAPSGFSISKTTSTKLVGSWTDNSTNELRFRIEEEYGGGGWVFLVNAAENATGYNDTILPTIDSIQWRIRAENSNGNSVWVYSNILGGL